MSSPSSSSSSDTLDWDAVERELSPAACVALQTLADSPTDLLYLQRADVAALVGAGAGALKLAHVAKLYELLDSWSCLRAPLGLGADEVERLAAMFATPSELAERAAKGDAPARPEWLTPASWSRLLRLVAPLARPPAADVATASPAHDPWSGITLLNLSDEAWRALRAVASEPTELIFLPPRILYALVEKQHLNKERLLAIFRALDSWRAVAPVVGLTKDDMVQLYTKGFTHPSVLAAADFDGEALEAIAGLGLSDKTQARLLRIAKLFFRYSPHDLVDKICDEGKPLSPNSAGDNSFEKLFAGVGKRVRNGQRVEGRRLLDTDIAEIVGSSQNVRGVLDAVSSSDRADILEIDFNTGYLTDVTPVLEQLDEFRAVCYIDLSMNRICTDQMPHIRALLKKMADRGGAVNVFGHPCASTDARNYFEEWCAESDGLKSFLHLIWIPEDWIDSRTWENVLGKEGHRYADVIALAHKAFYKTLNSRPV